MKNKFKFLALEERIVLDAALATIIYVNASAHAGGDGSSWAHAYSSLRDALTKAASTPGPDQIWIAQGTYTPSQIYSPNGVIGGASGLNTAQLKTFNLPSNVTLIGGFVSGATSVSQSNALLHPTVLDGNLGGGVDVWHVVTAGNDVADTGVTATLENLTIKDGLANGPDSVTGSTLNYSHESGGGIYERFGSNLTLNGVTLTNDSAALAPVQGIAPPSGGNSGLVPGGGGISVLDSTLTVNNSNFNHDLAGVASTVYGDGGAIFGYDATITVSNSVFTSNSAATAGGAIGVEYSNPMNISNSTFNGNSTTNSPTPNFEGGGGVQVFDTSLNLSNSSFTNNSASYEAGAVLVQFQGEANAYSINLQNDIFTGNSGGEEGSITITSQGDANSDDLVTINNSQFIGNSSGGVAGAIDIDSINVNITNTQFIGNTAAASGGAVNSDDFFNSFLGTPLTTVNLTNDNFIGNTAQGSAAAIAQYVGLFSSAAFGAEFSPGGGAVESMWGSQINITNSTFTGNTAANGNGGAVLSGGGYIYLNVGAPSDLIVATGATTVLNNDVLLGNSASHGNGGAAASEALYGPTNNPTGLAVPSLSIKNSQIDLNRASNEGGAVYMSQSNNTLQMDGFLLNFANTANEVYGNDATINGEATSSPSAAHDLALANSFYLLENGDIQLS